MISYTVMTTSKDKVTANHIDQYVILGIVHGYKADVRQVFTCTIEVDSIYRMSSY